jgi:uncharacterized protein YbjT (DUF2867 family)
MSSERVFVIGGTGNIGAKCVNDLLAKNVAVTLYARNPEKASAMFSQHNSDLVQIIKGDFVDLSPIQEGIKGHTRLFLLVGDFSSFVKTKHTIAKYAYEAGVKQIVDISSFTVNMGWRTSVIGSNHYLGEKAIFDIPNRGHFVALRPGRFMSNMFNMTRPLADGAVYDQADADHPHGWISPNDIGAVAAVVLSEDFEKHCDAVYNLTGDVSTSAQRVQALSRILGREVAYRQVSPAQKYAKIMESGHFPHLFALDLCDNLELEDNAKVTPCIEILLGRKPETMEEYLAANKSSIQ